MQSSPIDDQPHNVPQKPSEHPCTSLCQYAIDLGLDGRSCQHGCVYDMAQGPGAALRVCTPNEGSLDSLANEGMGNTSTVLLTLAGRPLYRQALLAQRDTNDAVAFALSERDGSPLSVPVAPGTKKNRCYGVVDFEDKQVWASLPDPSDLIWSQGLHLRFAQRYFDDPSTRKLVVDAASPLVHVLATLNEWGLARALDELNTLSASTWATQTSMTGFAAWALLQYYTYHEDALGRASLDQTLASLEAGFPDFSIIRAAIAVRRGARSEDSDGLIEAKRFIRFALQSGLPLYTQSVRLLLETVILLQGFERARKASPAEQAHTDFLYSLVQWLAVRTDPRQPFATVELDLSTPNAQKHPLGVDE